MNEFTVYKLKKNIYRDDYNIIKGSQFFEKSRKTGNSLGWSSINY